MKEYLSIEELLKNTEKVESVVIFDLYENKKAHNSAYAFGLFSLIQNMRETFKICMSNKKTLINIIILCSIFLLNSTFAYAGIDAAGNKMYYKLVEIGKWVIIFKGAIDIIQSIISGDTLAAKKLFLGYLFAYAVLFALPWCMNEVESVFKEM